MRADARRNRELLLDAAVDLILEAGGEPSRDAIAGAAGVGIGTLYRHFPDRQSLLRAVALHVIDRSIAAGEAALEDASGVGALGQYLHHAVDSGLGALSVVHPLLADAGWPDRRARADALLGEIVDRAQRDGALRADVTARDIGFVIMRASRPLAVGLSAAEERAIAHRHIDIYLQGLVHEAACPSQQPSA